LCNAFLLVIYPLFLPQIFGLRHCDIGVDIEGSQVFLLFFKFQETLTQSFTMRHQPSPACFLLFERLLISLP